MRAFLQATAGRSAGQKEWLMPETSISVGQGGRAQWVIKDDPELAADHFEVSWDGKNLSVSSTGQAPLWVDAEEVELGDTVEAQNGSLIWAGASTFLLRTVPDDLRLSLPPAPPRVRPRTESLVAARKEALVGLNKEEKLFAILDAARDRRVQALLNVCGERSQSLYDGIKGSMLAEVAPYLVQLEKDSALLNYLVNEAWGESWGVFLIGARPFVEVRRRLRRSLMVRDESSGKKMYFRFYDPRVLRAFWPVSSTRQKSEMVGAEIHAFILEGKNDEILRMTP